MVSYMAWQSGSCVDFEKVSNQGEAAESVCKLRHIHCSHPSNPVSAAIGRYECVTHDCVCVYMCIVVQEMKAVLH